MLFKTLKGVKNNEESFIWKGFFIGTIDGDVGQEMTKFTSQIKCF